MSEDYHIDEDTQPEYTVVPPHQYPIWVITIGIALLMCSAYALKFLPNYLEAAKNLRLGQLSYNIGDFNDAIKHFESVLVLTPTSKTAKIAIAKAYFLGPDRSKSDIGLDYLEGLSLSDSEWKDIKEVMPLDYQKYFKTVEK